MIRISQIHQENAKIIEALIRERQNTVDTDCRYLKFLCDCVVVYYVIVIFPLCLSLTGLFVLFLIFAFDVPCTRNPYLRVG